MTKYTINGNVVTEIKLILPDGKEVVIRPHDEVTHEDIILFPEESKCGEFSWHGVNPSIIGSREGKNIYLVLEGPTENIISYAPEGVGKLQPLVIIGGAGGEKEVG